jgi:ABC-type transport system involved in multi-copper enzyme maturation permease subunit
MRLLTTEILRLSRRRMLFWMLLGMLGLAVTIVIVNTALSKDNTFDVMRVTDLWLTDHAAVLLGVDQRQRIGPISVISYLLIIVLGASAVGAEYRAGTVTTILTWEPRRVRLLLARIGAAAVVAIAFYLVVHVVFVGGWLLGAGLRGTTAGADGGFWRDLAFVVLRGVVVAGVLAVLSAALATLGRNTGAALGIWFGYLVAVEAIFAANVKAVTRVLLTVNAAAFFGWEEIRVNGREMGPEAALLQLLLWILVLGGAAAAVFARRDVT